MPPPSANQVTVAPSKDNTLYEDVGGALSNGAGEVLFAGKTGPNAGFVVRRAVIAFDVAASLPAGATVTGATLTLNVSKQSPFAVPSTIDLHRLEADWGEGTSNAVPPPPDGGGDGAASTTGDATWIHTFFNTANWTNAGGDYSATISGSQSVVGLGPHSWTGPQMIADVQSWLDGPSNDFGWIIIGDEVTTQSARRFDSRENTTMSDRPQLSITYIE
ncbi:MAG: DNRLRE domain-containing protein [bacterium]|nr:DNRLRE domain-containing protein [bacterium]